MISANLIIVAAIVAAAVGVGFALVRFGRRDQVAKDSDKELSDVAKANEVERDVERLSDADVAKRLRKWTK